MTRAVTTCDGCWHIRGHFSQNCTFIIKNYLTGGILYYGHLSMRGADNICDEELWQGTSKAAEGHLAQVLWAKAKAEDLVVEVNWQDGDFSSAKGFRYSFPNQLQSKVMLCGGHVGRAHGKKLQELQTKSSLSSQYIALHKKDFPEVESVKCCCAGKKHTFISTRNKPACGCISPGFIQSAKRNHYCALVHAGTDPDKHRHTMLTLGKYHSRDIHEWEGGSCSFHPLVKCVCKQCDVDGHGDGMGKVTCSGEPYHSAHVLKCELHRLAYEIECAHIAEAWDDNQRACLRSRYSVHHKHRKADHVLAQNISGLDWSSAEVQHLSGMQASHAQGAPDDLPDSKTTIASCRKWLFRTRSTALSHPGRPLLRFHWRHKAVQDDHSSTAVLQTMQFTSRCSL